MAALAVGIASAAVLALTLERTAFRAMRCTDLLTLLSTIFAGPEILKVLFQNGISARPVPISYPAA